MFRCRLSSPSTFLFLHCPNLTSRWSRDGSQPGRCSIAYKLALMLSIFSRESVICFKLFSFLRCHFSFPGIPTGSSVDRHQKIPFASRFRSLPKSIEVIPVSWHFRYCTALPDDAYTTSPWGEEKICGWDNIHLWQMSIL